MKDVKIRFTNFKTSVCEHRMRMINTLYKKSRIGSLKFTIGKLSHKSWDRLFFILKMEKSFADLNRSMNDKRQEDAIKAAEKAALRKEKNLSRRLRQKAKYGSGLIGPEPPTLIDKIKVPFRLTRNKNDPNHGDYSKYIRDNEPPRSKRNEYLDLKAKIKPPSKLEEFDHSRGQWIRPVVGADFVDKKYIQFFGSKKDESDNSQKYPNLELLLARMRGRKSRNAPREQ
jgi:hypothetical protein